MNKFYTLISALLISLNPSFAQENSGVIRGKVIDASSNEPIPFASVVIWNTTVGAMTDFDGNFLFTGVRPGYVEIRASSVGYKPYVSESVMVTNSNEVNFTIPLEATVVEITDVVVKASPFRKKIESPVSARIIGIEEIELNPRAALEHAEPDRVRAGDEFSGGIDPHPEVVRQQVVIGAQRPVLAPQAIGLGGGLRRRRPRALRAHDRGARDQDSDGKRTSRHFDGLSPRDFTAKPRR